MGSASAIVSSPEVPSRHQLSSPVNRPFWLTCRWFLRSLLRPIVGLRGFIVEGKDHLPRRRRPCIVVANHAAFVDSIYFILALPVRFVICGAKPRLFRNARLRALMALANILRVEGHGQFLADCGHLLGRGEVLLIYPEMGRNPEAMGDFETWAAEVAQASQVPVVPCYLYGTTRGHRGPVRIRFGAPLDPGDAHGETTETTVLELTAAMRSAIESLAAMEAPSIVEAPVGGPRTRRKEEG